MQSFLNQNIILQKCSYGYGLFAKNDIDENTLIIDWTNGPGILMSTKDAYACEAKGNVYTLQISNNRHLVSVHTVEPCDYINHSCNPNCGINGSARVVSMKKILKGEEVTFDYCMTEASPLFNLKCLCRSEVCRGTITGNDWKIPALQERYNGFFSGYIQKKISASNSGQVRIFSRRKLEDIQQQLSRNGADALKAV